MDLVLASCHHIHKDTPAQDAWPLQVLQFAASLAIKIINIFLVLLSRLSCTTARKVT